MILNKNSKLVRWAYWFDPVYDTIIYTLPDGRKFTSYSAMMCACSYNTKGVTTKELRTNLPQNTSLCRFFWRAFLITPIITPFALIGFGLVTLISAALPLVPKIKLDGMMAFQKPLSAFTDKAADTASDCVNWLVFHPFWKLIGTFIRATKGRMCPIITFTDGDQ